MRKVFILTAFALTSLVVILTSCQTEEQLNYARYYTNGKQVYEQHCQNCHGSDGKGLARLYPPLTDSIFLKKNYNKLACVVRYGLSDPITINGLSFSEAMPGELSMPEIDIAAVITYITNSFGNKQGLYDVAKAGADLKACKNSNENK